MSTGKWCWAGALVFLTMLCPSAVFAAPPANVKVTESGGMITATWDNPSYDGSNVPSGVEIAHNSTTGSDGSFSDSTKITAPLNPGDVTYTSPVLPNGAYYIHVGAYQLGNPNCDVDPSTGELVCPTDYSPAVSVKIGPGPPNIGPGPPNIGDTATRFKNLRVTSRQKAAKLLVLAAMDEPGTVTVGGSVSVSGAARAFKIKPISARAAAGKAVTVKVKLSKRAQTAIVKALKRHRKVKATLIITAKDGAGNEKAEKRSVRLN
jgi:hypothetical protein